jgi:hypothetical protein
MGGGAVTRWADTFAALSRGADTLDTMRHSEEGAATVSQTVNSVAASPQSPAPVDRPLARWSESEKEHAAIVEYDGNIPRAWAEGYTRLHPDRPPADVLPRRWQTFIDDVELFLDSPFCAVAAALGWGPLDLFGCDRGRPFARIDHAGLLWLLNGDKLVEIDRHKAVIQGRTGARQTYHRKPVAVGEVVLAWELAP